MKIWLYILAVGIIVAWYGFVQYQIRQFEKFLDEIIKKREGEGTEPVTVPSP